METKRILKTVLSLLLAFAMTFTPIFSSTASIAYAVGADEQQVTESLETPVDKNAPDDVEEIAPADSEAVETDPAQPSVEATPAAEPEEEVLPEEVPEDESVKADTKDTYVYEDETVRVVAKLTEAGAVPDDAELKVTPIDKTSKAYNYDAYMDALNEGSASYDENNTLLYDIAFIKDGVEIQPASGKVSVSFEFLDSQLSESIGAKKASDVSVIHLPLTDEVKEQYDTTADAKKIDAGDINVEALTADDNELKVSVKNEKVVFNTDSFSVFAYTVDFEYEGYTFSIPGGGTIELSKVFEQLGIDKDVKNVEKVTFSNPALVEVKEPSLFNRDWTLKSLKAFSTKENLTVEMKDGEVIEITVTDAQDRTATISLFEDDGRTPVTDSGLDSGKGYFIVARLTDNKGTDESADDEIIGYQYKFVSATELPEYEWTYNDSQFKKVDESGSIAYDESANHAISYRVYEGSSWDNWRQNYGQITELPDHISGYLPIGASTDGNNTTVAFRKGFPPEYQVEVVIDPSITPEELAGLQLYAEAQHASTGTDKYTRPVPTSSEIIVLYDPNRETPSSWDENPGGRFTGNETTKAVVKDSNGNEFPSGSVINGLIINYLKKTEAEDESAHETKYTDHISIKKLGELGPAIGPTDVIGEAAEFGIVANTYKQTGHTETNYAVINIDHNSNNDVCGSGDGYMPFYVSNVINEHGLDIHLTSCPIDLFIPADQHDNLHYHTTDLMEQTFEDGTPKLTEINLSRSEIEDYVNGLIAYGKQRSEELASQPGLMPNPDSNYKTIDTTNLPDGKTIYIDCTNCADTIAVSGWIINKLPNQSIVFNIPGENVKIGEFHVNVYDESGNKIDESGSTTDARDDGTSEKNRKVDEIVFDHIFFNAYEAKTLDLNNASGLFLAPEAETVTQSNGAGWILTGGTVDSSTEWHFYRHERNYKAKGDFALAGKKKIVNAEGKEVSYEDFSSMTFTFELYACDENGSIPEGETAIETVTADSNGDFAFNKLKYTEKEVPEGEEETFYYVIKEQDHAKENGVTYSADPVYVKVVATDAAESAVISFEISKGADVGSWTLVDNTGTDEDKIYEIGDFENTYEEESGSLKIKKIVTENGRTPSTDSAKSKLAGTYTFTIYTDSDCSTPYMDGDSPKTVTLEIDENGTEATSEEITGLPAGTYWIKETFSGSNHEDVHAIINPVEITVEAGKTGENAAIASFTNNVNTGGYNATTSYSGKKKWANDDPTHRPSNLDISLFRNGEKVDNPSLVWTKDGNEWTYEFKNLPVFDEDGSVYSYSVEETTVPDNYSCTTSPTPTEYTLNTTGTPSVINPCAELNFSLSGDYDLGYVIIKCTGKHEADFVIWTQRAITATERDYLLDTAKKAFSELDSSSDNILFLSGVPMNYDRGSITTRMENNEITLNFNSHAEWAKFAYGHYTATYEPGTTELTNTRETGDLELSKVLVSDAAADKDAEFTFTVTLGDESITGKYGSMTFTKGVATVKLKGGETATATGLPTGVTYTITEAAATGFKQTGKTGDSGTISTTKSEATFTNTRETGDLELSKVLVSDAAADKDAEFTFTVTVTGLSNEAKNKAYGDMTFANGVATVTLKGGEKATATGLPTGVTYTITEAAAPGFTVTKDGDSGTISTTKSEATFTNTRETGDLELSKVLVSDAAADANAEFTFTVTLSDTTISKTYGDMTFANGVANVTLKGGESATATGLPTGVTYTITEAEATGFKQTGKTGDTGTISTTKSTATFTNTRDTGDLEVSKTVVSTTASDKTKDFNFTVILSDETITGKYGDMTFTNGVARFTLKNGETKSAEGLPTGITYTVEEETAEGFTITKTGETGQITTNKAEAKFTNSKIEGGLIVSKSVTSPVASDRTTREYEFTVTLEDGTITGEYGDMTFTNGVATFTLKDGETKSAEGLPDGLGYTVEETTYEDMITSSTGSTGKINENKDEAGKPITSTAEFINSKIVGDLTVSKTLVSDAAADANVGFTFTVTLSDTTIAGVFGEMTFVDGVATVTLKGGESATATGLPTGVTYTITEAAATGFQQTGKTGDSGTISTTKSTATFTNTRETGDLELSKVLVSDAAADANAEFTFTVTLGDTTISKTYGDMTFTDGVATVTLKGGEKATATGLPTGVTYTITEAEATGFKQTGKTGDTGTISTTKSEATFTNTRETGGLKVSKAVISDAAADKDTKFTFTVTLSDTTIDSGALESIDVLDLFENKYGDMIFRNGVATFELKGGESISAENLPTGITYTVTEAEATGFTQTCTTGNSTGTISTTKSEVEFTNTRETGDLELSKVLVSDAAADKDTEFTFTVTLSDTTISKTYGDMTFANGVATVTLKGGEKATATGLPTGVTYTITETAATGFTQTCTTGNSSGTISTTKSEVEFTNTRETGDLELSKVLVSDAAADKDAEFTFTVTLSDTTISKTYGDMAFTDGVATVKLKGGEKATATGLPTGVTYTITEAEATGFKQTGKTGDTGTISTTKSTATFTNTRETGDLELSKVLVSDAAADKDTEFTFTVTLSDTTISKTYGDMTFANGVATVTLKGGEKATATGLPTGVTYTITEETAAGFQVTDKTGDSGTISTTKSEATFTNARETGDLELSKVLVSDSTVVSEQEFTFTVTVTGLSNEAKNKAYGDMTFTDGVATVKLKGGEKATATGLPTGVTYTITEAAAPGFTVTKDGDSGTISTTKSEAKFTNTYSARGEGSISVQKLLEGREWTNKDEFTFTISAGEGTPMPAQSSITIKKSDRDQTKSFGEIEFTKEGTYIYTVKETKGTLGGVTYDEKEHTVTIKAIDDGKGNIVAAEGSQLIQTEKFTNTYRAVDDKGEILVQKVLNGREWKDDDEFEFVISAVDGTPMPATKSIIITKDDKDHIKSFGQIDFTKAGKYTYVIKEVEGDIEGVKYDKKTHTVTIEVIDDGEGHLVAKSGTSLIQTVKITNTYSSDKPKTGDDNNIYIPLAGMFSSLTALLSMIIYRRKRKA